jgi:hypothetical protein
LQPLWMICSWVGLLSSIACKLAHAFRGSYTCNLGNPCVYLEVDSMQTLS